MSFFIRFKGKPKIRGELGYFGLGDWWQSTFTAKEHDYIERTYRPMSVGDSNERPLTQGEITSTSQTAMGLLSGLAGWFKKPEDLSIARRLLAKAESQSGSDPLDRHFLFQEMIQIYYRARDDNPSALEEAIAACNKQIANAPIAAQAFMRDQSPSEAQRTFGARLPAHVGYTQLAIIREKQKNYAEAIRLSRQAQQEGWAGDWDKRIARCEDRLRKLRKS